MADLIKLEIVSKDKTLVDRGDVLSVTAPGIGGDLGILSHHAALVTVLKEGVIHYKTENEKFEIPIKSGFIEVSDNNVKVLVSELAEENN